jgi:hypothetical protein
MGFELQFYSDQELVCTHDAVAIEPVTIEAHDLMKEVACISRRKILLALKTVLQFSGVQIMISLFPNAFPLLEQPTIEYVEFFRCEECGCYSFEEERFRDGVLRWLS